MRTPKAFIIFIASIALIKCADSNITEVMPDDNWKLISFEELSVNSVPPCLDYTSVNFEIVMKDYQDYEDYRRRYAPQGEYVYYDADGYQSSFGYPYTPLDRDNNGKIDPYELIIYVTKKPLYAHVNGETILVSSNPMHLAGDSLLIFSTTYPYTVERKIHYSEVFTVDPATGKITFNIPPLAGSKLSLSAQGQLYEIFDNRSCSMQYFNFSDKIVIGKSINGDGCLIGIDKALFIDRTKRQIIYYWKGIKEEPQNGCPPISNQFTNWIAVEKPQDEYKVVFVERTEN